MQSNRGFIIPTSIFLVFILITFIGGLMAQTAGDLNISERIMRRERAFHLAEAALDATVLRLHVGDFTDLPDASMGGGTYWAEVAPAGTPLEFTITSHGDYRASVRGIEATAHLVPTSVFRYALFGADQLIVSGDVVTDSYDSTSGAYDPMTAGSHGDIGTNATAVGGVTVDGSILVNGQVAVGPDVLDPDSVVDVNGGSATITGVPPYVSQPVAMPVPPVSIPVGLPCPNLTVNGNVVHTLQSSVGVYCFDRLTVGGGAHLTADGPVVVYIKDSFSATGSSVVGVVGDPTKLVMRFSSNSTATIENTLAGTTDFYGGIYAPETSFEISGNTRIYGAVIAQTVEASGDVLVHYDEAMAELSAPTGFYLVNIKSWREL